VTEPTMDRETFTRWMAENDVPWDPYLHQIPTDLLGDEAAAWCRGWTAACFALLNAGRPAVEVPE